MLLGIAKKYGQMAIAQWPTDRLALRSLEVGCGGARPIVRQHVVWPRAAAATGFRAGRGRQNVGRTPPPQRGYTRGHGAAGVGGGTDHPLVPWGAVATLQLEASPQ